MPGGRPGGGAGITEAKDAFASKQDRAKYNPVAATPTTAPTAPQGQIPDFVQNTLNRAGVPFSDPVNPGQERAMMNDRLREFFTAQQGLLPQNHPLLSLLQNTSSFGPAPNVGPSGGPSFNLGAPTFPTQGGNPNMMMQQPPSANNAGGISGLPGVSSGLAGLLGSNPFFGFNGG